MASGHGWRVRTVEDLFRRHAADVLGYALRRADASLADDVVSEVFVIAGRKLASIPDEDPLLWLYAVARRVLANQRRAASRRVVLYRALAVLGRDQPHHAPPGDRGAPLLDALAALRPADREVLILTAWEGLGAAHAAVVLGCSTAAVHQRLSRARTRLAAELAARGAARPRPAEVTP
jgi:RNA polymerase sigma factor (sigma-70 family)